MLPAGSALRTSPIRRAARSVMVTELLVTELLVTEAVMCRPLRLRPPDS
jgi:hypothetical protein